MTDREKNKNTNGLRLHDRYGVGLGYSPSGALQMDMTGEVYIWVDGKCFERESEQDDHAWCWMVREGLLFERDVLNYDGSHSLFFRTPLSGTLLPTVSNYCDVRLTAGEAGL